MFTAATVECSQHKPIAVSRRGRRYRITQVNGRWRLGGRWWEGEGEKWFFRVVTTSGAVADLCYQPDAHLWTVHQFYG